MGKNTASNVLNKH